MQLIKALLKGEASASSLPYYKFVIPALFLVSLLIYGETVHYGHSYTFIICGIVALSLLMKDHVLSIFCIYMACWFGFLLCCGFRGLISGEILFQALDTATFIMAGMAFYIMVRRGTGLAKVYMNGICILCLILSAAAFIQYFFGHGHPGSTLGNRNFYAAFIAISIPFFFRSRWVWFVPVICLGLTIAKTSTAIAAAFVSVSFYLWGWKGVGLSVIPSVLYFILFKTPESLIERWFYWTDALTKMCGSWKTVLFGVGPGVYWRFGNELHSEPVYLLFNLGIIGLLLIAVYIFKSFYKQRNRVLQAALLAVVVDSFGNHLMHTAPTALLVITILALNGRTEGSWMTRY